MKIFLQDRGKIIDMPREVWIGENGGYFTIFGTSYITPVLGNYKTEQRAKEVLDKMFDYYQENARCYVMPQE